MDAQLEQWTHERQIALRDALREVPRCEYDERYEVWGPVICEHLNRSFAFLTNTSRVLFVMRSETRAGGLEMSTELLKEFCVRLSAISNLQVVRNDKDQSVVLKGAEIAEIWRAHANCRMASGTVFAPPGGPAPHPSLVNLYIPPQHRDDGDPNHPAVGVFRQHIIENLADGDAVAGMFFICWLAWMVQFPGEKMASCIIMYGPEGSGKGSVYKLMQRVLGSRYCASPPDLSLLFEKLSADIFQQNILMFLDEVSWGGNKSDAGKLKALITESTATRRTHHQGARNYDQISNFMIGSNHEYCAQVDKDGRRPCVLHTNGNLEAWKEAGDPRFHAIRDVFSLGQFAGEESDHHIVAYMRSLDLAATFDHRAPPLTRGREEVVIAGLDGLEGFWLKMLEEEPEWLFGKPFFKSQLEREFAYRDQHARAGKDRGSLLANLRRVACVDVETLPKARNPNSRKPEQRWELKASYEQCVQAFCAKKLPGKFQEIMATHAANKKAAAEDEGLED